MSTAFESIKQGLSEAVAHARGERIAVRVYEPRLMDVAAPVPVERSRAGTTIGTRPATPENSADW